MQTIEQLIHIIEREVHGGARNKAVTVEKLLGWLKVIDNQENNPKKGWSFEGNVINLVSNGNSIKVTATLVSGTTHYNIKAYHFNLKVEDADYKYYEHYTNENLIREVRAKMEIVFNLVYRRAYSKGGADYNPNTILTPLDLPRKRGSNDI